jgi:hypothetical protein
VRRSRSSSPTSVVAPLFVMLVILALGSPANAWDWRTPFAIRDDGETTVTLELGASTLLPLATLPDDVHGFGGRLRGEVHYIDDDKFVTLEIATADFFSVYRSQRDRYDVGSFPSLALFDLVAQMRLTPSAHLIYGIGLMRSGAMTHAASAGLAYRLGFALPFFGRDAETMHEYRRSYLQIETLPLVGSFLTNVLEEGFYDNEHPIVQVQGEVALTGRMLSRIGTFEAETRLSASYVGQRSMMLRIGLRFVGHAFARRRLAGLVQSQYLVPLRPLRSHTSDDGERLVYDHHLSLTIGIVFFLDGPAPVAPGFSRDDRREFFEQRWDVRRGERDDRQTTRRSRRALNHEERELRQGRRRPHEGRELRRHRNHRRGDLEETVVEDEEEEEEEGG